MITPSYGLTATERVLPSMALDFTTATLDSRVTFTRSGNTATVTDFIGNIKNINANLPRFDYDPTTLVCKGLLIEEARTNLLLNSLISGIPLVTQLVTTTAVAHTLSFYGTGTIVLTGTSSATVVGTGAYPSRRTLTFTPTAGVLTLTVTGTVQFAQLEVGSFATSFIPTDATSKTRNADVAVMTGTNFSSWYNASEGSFVTETISPFATQPAGAQAGVFIATDGTMQNYINLAKQSNATNYGYVITTGNVTQFSINVISPTTANQNVKCCVAYKLNNFAASGNANAVSTSISGTIPTVNKLVIGQGHQLAGTWSFNGYIKKLFYYSQRLINNEVQAFSK